MEISRRRKNGATLEDLRENCISSVLSFTTAKDVCRLAAVCRCWGSAADADLVWEKMIIQRFGEKISKGFSSLSFPFKKHLYICLVKDNETKTIWLDEFTGKIGCMTPPRDLCIHWADYYSYFKWERRNDSSASINFHCWPFTSVVCGRAMSFLWLRRCLEFAILLAFCDLNRGKIVRGLPSWGEGQFF
ncbi:hypothetical protein SUGI_0382300 [Cryptomeria japonica]|uniref:F-box protein PP2-B3-like n=1 Tax=Cryptomeria japonica TaxID=3369 RepID=UPI0024089DB2|nr:F-box protein PP2-B3-like [Cryptomeria japonica]GLJ20943.1 hypothetical protein SUGI_0382300 [Cryptomeria japonica]